MSSKNTNGVVIASQTQQPEQAAYDYLFKFLIIGSAGVGKSCVLHHFIENKCKSILSYYSLNIL
jgi:GTPase SAR1 family protein